ncbi:MAG: hypothetical protein GY797_05995 [Deltaproteobacteria bacterium]|nr:hypothetical protein [Deltaproteobacteria bacterium]
MSVDWGVVPIVPEIQDWLKENGFVIEISETRYPTFDELIVVLETFNLPVKKDQIKENLFDIVVGEINSDQYAYILGSIEKDGFEFHFWGSSCQEQTMLEILKRLSVKCGALVIYESIAATPLVVDAKTNIEKAIDEWNHRIRERYAE